MAGSQSCHFGYDKHQTDAALERLLKRYKRTKRAIPVDFRKLVSLSQSAERATHLLHPYPAKLLMQIPFFFLANSVFSGTGDVVADPFCGSGTVLLEAQLAGRQAIGADSNPFARLLTVVKTSPIPAETLNRGCARLLSRIPSEPRNGLPNVVNLKHWFYPHVIRQLHCVSEAVESTRRSDLHSFFRICFSNCVRRVSLADPRLSVPVRLRLGQYPRGHHLRAKTDAHIRRLRRIDVVEVFSDVLAANCRRLLSLESCGSPLPSARLVASDARRIAGPTRRAMKNRNGSRETDGFVQLAITSPPYPGAQKYIRACSLSLGWLGLCSPEELVDLKRLSIGREEMRRSDYGERTASGLVAADRVLEKIGAANSLRGAIAAAYLAEMREAIREVFRAVKKGGYFVLVAANNRIAGHEFRTADYLRQMAEETGFHLVLRLIDDIRSRGLMTKRNQTASVITREWVLVFAK